MLYASILLCNSSSVTFAHSIISAIGFSMFTIEEINKALEILFSARHSLCCTNQKDSEASVIIVFEFHQFSCFISNFLYNKSMAKAPKGAVITIARTATVKIVSPQAKPIAKGIPPIAA